MYKSFKGIILLLKGNSKKELKNQFTCMTMMHIDEGLSPHTPPLQLSKRH